MRAVVQIVSPPLDIDDEADLTAKFAHVCRHHGIIKAVQDLTVIFHDRALSSQHRYVPRAVQGGQVSADSIARPLNCPLQPDRSILDAAKSEIFVQLGGMPNWSLGAQDRISSDMRYVLSDQLKINKNRISLLIG